MNVYYFIYETPEIIESYFRNLKSVMQDNDLTYKTQYIFNLDETSIQPEHRPSNITRTCSKTTLTQKYRYLQRTVLPQHLTDTYHLEYLYLARDLAVCYPEKKPSQTESVIKKDFKLYSCIKKINTKCCMLGRGFF